MGLMDGDPGPAPSKVPRNIFIGVIVLMAVTIPLYLLLRFHTEKATANLFLNELVAGDYQGAYRTWKPGSGYSYDDFMRDWGPTGEYGPVKSYDLRSARSPAGASGVVITVDVSTASPFPGNRGASNVKEVRLWVEHSDQSISYAPEEIHIVR
ncbi:MAG TPA: hypothetical protein VMV61_00530 [Patescibacteria group bacterium]|nr:hypothetical protein [Patescibacteria group bacterium]